MTPYRRPPLVVWDQAFPLFWIAPGARPAADRFHARYGIPPARWELRDRAVARFRRAKGPVALSPLEVAEVREWLGPDPVMQAAVRFVREHRRLARLLRLRALAR